MLNAYYRLTRTVLEYSTVTPPESMPTGGAIFRMLLLQVASFGRFGYVDCCHRTGELIFGMKHERGCPRHKNTRTDGLYVFFLILLHNVKHIVFEGKITCLEEKDHRYVDDIKIVFQCEVHVGCRFAIVEWCAECKVAMAHQMSAITHATTNASNP